MPANQVTPVGSDSGHHRTPDGFGVGAYVPLSPCYRTQHNPWEHRWKSFVSGIAGCPRSD